MAKKDRSSKNTVKAAELPAEVLSLDGEPYKPPREHVVELPRGELASKAIEVEKLLRRRVEIYRRDNTLVRPVRTEVPASDGRKTVTISLQPVSEYYLLYKMSEYLEFRRWSKTEQKWAVCDPPNELAKIILARAGDWRFDPIIGVLSCPTLRPDGTILSAPGYDKQTGYYLTNLPKEMPTIPDRPTQDDAQEAIKLLDTLLGEFPFVDKGSRGAALSMLITLVIRAALPTAPLHAVNAFAPGSGKSYLVDIASTIATGQSCPVIGFGQSKAENRKTLDSKLIDGYSLISIDNVDPEDSLGGDYICQAVERPIVDVRILGLSKVARINNSAFFMATGNNLKLTGDIVRRAVMCKIWVKEAEPELRSFQASPIKTILDNRGEYVAASLTVVKAYIDAGYPAVCTPLGSFEEWSNKVRSALVWLGYDDPVATMEQTRRSDPERQALQSFLFGFQREYGLGEGKARTAGEIKERVETSLEDDHPLYAAVEHAFSVSGKKTPKSLGNWFSKHEGSYQQVEVAGELGTYCLSKLPVAGRPAKWFVEKLEPEDD